MSFLDFLFNNSKTPYNPAASPDANVGLWDANEDNANFDYKSLLSDPNFIQALGGIGSGLAQGQSAGQALGDAAVGMSRNKALQSATAKQLNAQDDRLSMVLEALGRSGMLSSVDKNDKADWFKVDGNGSWTMGMKNTPQKPSFGGEEPSLESQTNQRNQRKSLYGDTNFL